MGIKITQRAIDHILKEAQSDFWKKTMGMRMSAWTKHWHDIMMVTHKGLIFIKGNAETGWEHIGNRHNYYSEQIYFSKKSFPSKFSSSLIPFHDFPDIANDIYKPENLVKDNKHEDAETFDKYIGESDRLSKTEGKKKFHLVTWKGTGIVHSLYPHNSIEKPRSYFDDKKFNDVGLLRARNAIRARTIISEHPDMMVVNIPYINEGGKVRYVGVLQIHLPSGTTRIEVVVRDKEGKPLRSEWIMDTKINTPINTDRLLMGLVFQDLTPIEKKIREIEKKEFK
jgi:hypothetical protein